MRGYLTDNDVRLPAIEQAMDDRLPEEKDPNSKSYIPKSRYSPISYFISESEKNREEYNDVHFPLSETYMEYFKEKQKEFGLNMDEKFIKHIGFLYRRDLLCIYQNDVEQNMESSAHFEVYPFFNLEHSKYQLELHEIQATPRSR